MRAPALIFSFPRRAALPLLLCLAMPAGASDFVPAPKLSLPAPVAAPAEPEPPAAAEPLANTAGIDANGWLRLVEGSNIACDPNYPRHPREMRLNNGATLQQEDWEGYLQPFVASLPVAKRAVVLDALTRIQTSYDSVDEVIRFEPPAEADYQGQSWIGLVGSISPTQKKVKAALMINAFGDSPLVPHRIKVNTDSAPWEFERLEFRQERDPPHLMEFTFLPLADEAHYNLVRGIIRARKSTVRVSGDVFYTDFAVSERMRKDIHLVLMAVDAINSLHAPQGVDLP